MAELSASSQSAAGRRRERHEPKRVRSLAVDEVATAPPRRASAAIARDDDGAVTAPPRAENLVRVSTQNISLAAASPSSG